MNLTNGTERRNTGIEALRNAARTGLLVTAEAGRRANRMEQVDDEAAVQLVGALISQASRGSDVRFELVAELRARIEAGTYKVEAADVAEKLMGALRQI